MLIDSIDQKFIFTDFIKSWKYGQCCSKFMIFGNWTGLSKFEVIYQLALCYGKYLDYTFYKKIKNITNVKRCRDGMPKSMQTR